MITRKDVFKEIVSPNVFEKSEDNKFLWVAVYKGIFMCIRLLLDIRTNQVQMATKMGIVLETKKDTPTD